MFQNSENLFVLKIKCAKFQTKKKSRKNDLLSSGNLKKKSQFFNLKSDFFLIFQKNLEFSKIPKIYLSWTLSESIFSKFRENFFWKKIPIFRKFCGFFSNFLKKISNVPKFRKFICPEVQVCEVSDKKKNLKKITFWVVGIWKKNPNFST